MNKIIITGNMGQDAQEKTTGGGTKYWVINVATTEKWMGKDGNKQSLTTWHRCMLYGNRENLIPYLRSGQQVAIVGLQRNDKYDYQDNGQPVQHNGKTIVMTMPYIKVAEIELIGGKRDDSQQAAPAQQQQAAPQQAAPAQQTGAAAATYAQPQQEFTQTDDLPF